MVKFMKAKQFFCLATLLLLSLVSRAQSREDYSTALDVLKGKTDVQSREWAIKTLEQCDDSVFRPIAMNALGIVYMRGIGTEPDTAKAISCFSTAGKLGNASAYRNLGKYYMCLPKEKQNFILALSCFESGFNLHTKGSELCAYNAGYMYYKGLGCKQDYAKALELFRKGAVGGLSYCKYMIGLCYRNGFGVEKDSDMAKAYLEDAAYRHNLKAALMELRNNCPEVITPSYIYNIDSGDSVEAMPTIEPVVFSPNDIYGEYNGVLVTYDWSGQHIVKEQLLSVAMWNGKNGNIAGRWVIGEDTLNTESKITEDGVLTFSDTEWDSYERYNGKDIVRYVVEQLTVSSVGKTLTGELRLYSLNQREPERPMFVCLNKDVDVNNSGDKYACKIYAYPVSNQQRFEVNFLLPEDTKQNSVCIYTQVGTPVKKFNLGELQAGKQTIQFPFDVLKGNYIVSVTADKYHGNSIINKK